MSRTPIGLCDLTTPKPYGAGCVSVACLLFSLAACVSLKTSAPSPPRCAGVKKKNHPRLDELLVTATVYRNYLAAENRARRQLSWGIELAHVLRTEDENGQPRRAQQVKREVRAFLEELERSTATDTEDAPIARRLIKTVRNRWGGLFTCYRVPGVPATNNDQEPFFNHLKQRQRRINGHKSVHEFVVRYGAYAAYVDSRETFDQLLERLRQVSDMEFQNAQQAWRENEAQLHKNFRFRHDRTKFLKELEADWEKINRR